MFFQPPDEEEKPNCIKLLKSNSRSRRQKKLRRKNKLKALKKYQKATKQKAPFTPEPTIPITMSSWAENFTRAATWQLKHELAFWKSKAMALEYENKLLHRVIRQNSIGTVVEKTKGSVVSFSKSESSDSEDDSHENPPVTQSDQDLEVSEEFIQFLRNNQAYRESARLERERMKAQNDVERKQIEEMEAGPAEVENQQEISKKLYGDAWERIVAVEMSLQTQFISIRDQYNPSYWPIEPLKISGKINNILNDI